MDDESATVAEYLPQVRAIAWRVHRTLPPNVELDDCVQAGVIGLLGAIRKRDESRHEGEWRRYVRLRVQGAVIDYVRSMHPFGENADPTWRYVDIDDALDVPADDDVLRGVLAREELRRTLAAIEHLPASGRAELIAIGVEGESAADYARRCGRTVTGVHTTICNTRRRLKQSMGV